MSVKPRRPGGPGGPRVPAHVVAELIRPLVDREGPASIARRCGLPQRRVFGILRGEQSWVSLDVADRLFTIGLRDPGLWHRDPRLVAALPPLQLDEIDEEAAAA